MKSLSQAVADSRQIMAETLLAGIDLALTYLDVASISDLPPTATLARQKALDAYSVIERTLAKSTLHLDSRELIHSRLMFLWNRLEETCPRSRY